MIEKLSRLVDFFSEFLAQRKGLLPTIGILFIIANAVLQFLPGVGWLAQTNLLLHIGIIVALLGVLLAWAL